MGAPSGATHVCGRVWGGRMEGVQQLPPAPASTRSASSSTAKPSCMRPPWRSQRAAARHTTRRHPTTPRTCCCVDCRTLALLHTCMLKAHAGVAPAERVSRRVHMSGRGRDAHFTPARAFTARACMHAGLVVKAAHRCQWWGSRGAAGRGSEWARVRAHCGAGCSASAPLRWPQQCKLLVERGARLCVVALRGCKCRRGPVYLSANAEW